MSEDTTKSTAVERIISAGKLALSQKGATLNSVMLAIQGEVPEVTDLFELSTTAPAQIKVSEAQALALKGFQELVDNFKFPTTVRQLEVEERKALLEFRAELDKLSKLVKDVDNSMKASAHNHFDLQAKADKRVNADTKTNDDGHYILTDSTSFSVPGMETTLKREVRQGAVCAGEPAELDDKVLEAYETGKIDRKTYLRWTRAARVVDREKMFKDLKDPKLMLVLRDIVAPKSSSCSINLRPNNGASAST